MIALAEEQSLPQATLTVWSWPAPGLLRATTSPPVSRHSDP